jgi:tetratricopeptide (TPR) repeat protein
MTRSFDLFLSHNSKDKPVVCEIAEALRRRGLQVWLDKDDLVPGQPWQEALEEIIETTRAAAVLVGKDGIGPWENREMRACLSELVDRELPVIPVLLPGAPVKPKLPLFLRAFTWVDLRSGITDQNLDRLVRGIPKAKRKRRSKLTGPPPLHNLPYPPLGDLLKGRDEELRALAESLQGDGQPRAIVQSHRTLYGLGGIGKTRLAVEYAWRFWFRYKAALFVSAESPEILRNGLAALAGLLGLPERQAQAETVQAVLLWLQANPGWLLILDNVDSQEAEREVLAIRPRLAAGHVLITSRLRDWPKTVHKQDLGTISLEEARAFLLKRTDGERRAAPDDEAQAWQLAEKLGGLPLALQQAGAYIAHTRLSFSEYLKIWENEKAQALEWHDETMEYPASVAATWKTSFDRLHPTAAALLRLSAFLAPDPIPEEMFESEKAVVEEIVEGEDRSSIREALAELESYSLISRQEATFTVHRVVQEVVQSRIPPERRREWIEASLKIVNGYSPVPPDDVRTWPVWNVLRPHASRIVLLADEAGVTDPTSRLMNELGLYLNTRGLYDEAEPLMRRSLAIAEASFGNEHPNVARDLNNLAQLLQATNRLSEAEPLMRRSLAIDEASFGNEHPDVAIDLNNLAALLQATNRLSEAEPLMRRSLAIDEASFGNEHPNVAIRLNNLAQLLKATNRLSEAEPLMRRSLAIDEASFGNEHPDVAIDLNNLALLLQATNRLSEAEPLMRRAVEIFERSLGPDHPWTKGVQGNLARLLAEIAEAAGNK